MTNIGILLAIGSAVFNGSFAALFKTPKMVEVDLHPIVFQLYVSTGVFLSSLLVVPFLSWNPTLLHNEKVGDEFRFSPMGFVAGCLLVLSLAASFQAVQKIGVALAQGIWCGGAMLVSYLWGIAVFGETPVRLGLSLLGLCLLILGVFGIALCEKIGKVVALEEAHHERQDESPETMSLIARNNSEETTSDNENTSYAEGVLWACAVAFFGGSVLAPMHYVPPMEEGLVFLPSFGIGAMVLSPLIYHLYSVRTGEMPPLHIKQALATGLVSGVTWNAGNFCSMLAIPAISYGVAYPIMQCALLVSGLWGIYAFHEITEHRTIATFWVGGVILVLGGISLAAAR
jgi:glucose uptake protein GlcU